MDCEFVPAYIYVQIKHYEGRCEYTIIFRILSLEYSGYICLLQAADSCPYSTNLILPPMFISHRPSVTTHMTCVAKVSNCIGNK